jgi:hypothetical protein
VPDFSESFDPWWVVGIGVVPFGRRFAHITTDTVYNVLRSSGTSPNFFNTG